MLTSVAGILVFLAIWQAGVMLSGVPAYLLPAPTEIAQTFIDEFPRLLRHGWVTTYEMLLGYLLAVAIAIPLAIAITSSQRFDQFVMPTMLFFQVVPKVAIAPLFLVWFGVGAMPKILVAFLISFFPIVIDAAVGLRYLLLVTNSNMETALMFATLVGLTFIGLVFFYSVEFLESLLIPWHVTHRIREESGTM
jgi:NitT/TauT family transport system permease protein